MAFRAHKNTPKDAVIISEMEATTYIWDTIHNWKNPSEMWALRYAGGILGGINSLSGILINSHYRNKLKLGSYGHISSLFPIVLLSGSFTMLFHRHVVTTDMVLRMKSQCPICYELKSALIQCGFGIFYPMVLAPTTAFMLANRYNTARLPSIVSHPKELFYFWKKTTRSLHGTVFYLAVAQLVASSIMTYFELKSTLVLRKTISDIEQRIDSELDQN